MEETGGGGNRRSLDDVGLCVSMGEACCAIWTFLFGFCSKSPVPSCEKRKMKKKGREGLAVQCLFSIRLLALGQELLRQLLPQSP